MATHRQSIEQVKEDAERLTRARINEERAAGNLSHLEKVVLAVQSPLPGEAGPTDGLGEPKTQDAKEDVQAPSTRKKGTK